MYSIESHAEFSKLGSEKNSMNSIVLHCMDITQTCRHSTDAYYRVTLVISRIGFLLRMGQNVIYFFIRLSLLLVLCANNSHMYIMCTQITYNGNIKKISQGIYLYKRRVHLLIIHLFFKSKLLPKLCICDPVLSQS